MSRLTDLLKHALDDRARRSLLRRRVPTEPLDAVHVQREGRRLVNFSSNDYLGLSHHPRMLTALRDLAATGSGAAGLITGFTTLQAEAERQLAEWKSAAAAMLLPSGYQANLAVVQTLAAAAEAVDRPVRFLVDKLAHASMVDAVLNAAKGRSFRVFPHNGLSKLQRLLAEAPAGELQVVLTESIFSMDGDAADLAGLAELKKQHDLVLVLDEAHATGVYGENGAGLAAELGLSDIVDISVVTLSKALGLAGGAICASAEFINAVENFGRAFIYSTAIPPATSRLLIEAIAICREEPQRRRRVRELARTVRQSLAAAGLQIPPGDSPIIPIVLGDAAAAIAVADALREQGLLVMPVRPPTVPPGSSRLRVTLSSEHSAADIERLTTAIGQSGPSPCGRG